MTPSELVWRFFHRTRHGFFVDAGANHPTTGNQTWFLEEQGWTGILIEPHPDMAELLRQQRPKSRTFETAVGAPGQPGPLDFWLGGTQSSADPDVRVREKGKRVQVPIRTIDSVLEESGATKVDFVSLDVEGMELEALEGFNFERWRPGLLLIEDFFYNHKMDGYMRSRGYKAVKRTGYNNWYVPRAARASLLSMNSPGEIFHFWRKKWFSGPLIGARRRLKGRK
jgi:FkbM family methyltransferase